MGNAQPGQEQQSNPGRAPLAYDEELDPAPGRMTRAYTEPPAARSNGDSPNKPTAAAPPRAQPELDDVPPLPFVLRPHMKAVVDRYVDLIRLDVRDDTQRLIDDLADVRRRFSARRPTVAAAKPVPVVATPAPGAKSTPSTSPGSAVKPVSTRASEPSAPASTAAIAATTARRVTDLVPPPERARQTPSARASSSDEDDSSSSESDDRDPSVQKQQHNVVTSSAAARQHPAPASTHADSRPKNPQPGASRRDEASGRHESLAASRGSDASDSSDDDRPPTERGIVGKQQQQRDASSAERKAELRTARELQRSSDSDDAPAANHREPGASKGSTAVHRNSSPADGANRSDGESSQDGADESSDDQQNSVTPSGSAAAARPADAGRGDQARRTSVDSTSDSDGEQRDKGPAAPSRPAPSANQEPRRPPAVAPAVADERVVKPSSLHPVAPRATSTKEEPEASTVAKAATLTSRASGGDGSASTAKMSFKSEKCLVCAKTVYPAERISADEKIYHKTCFRCKKCSALLRLGSYASMDGEVFCKPCFLKTFRQAGNYSAGFGKLTPQAKFEQSKGREQDASDTQ